jgi:hypothetical protein
MHLKKSRVIYSISRREVPSGRKGWWGLVK